PISRCMRRRSISAGRPGPGFTARATRRGARRSAPWDSAASMPTASWRKRLDARGGTAMSAAGDGGPARRRVWPAWESELAVVRAADGEGLVRAVEEAISLARDHSRAPLASFARTLLRRLPEGRVCLAI